MLPDSRRFILLAWISLGVVSLWLRASALHRAMLYPDGYDYLLMARGIAAHLQPTLQLGPGGMPFSPPLDAALKPLFPALTALLAVVMPLRSAADLLTVLGGAATVMLSGLLVLRITGSQVAALAAGSFALVSPALAFWSGFTGPDALAPALALATAVLALDGRPVAAGVTGALCGATRPEWLLPALLVVGAATLRRDRRTAAANASIAGAFTLALILLVLRPPLGAHPSVHAGAGAAAVFTSSAVKQLLRDDWPILALAAAGLVLALRNRMGHYSALMLATVVLLGGVYLEKNPGSERYLAQLLPLLSVCAGMALARMPRRVGAALGAVSVAALIWLTAAEPGVGQNQFTAVAARLRASAPTAVVTAAPEAYGYLLPGRRIDPITPGARGIIVLDGAQRSYVPKLSARGPTLATVSAQDGFQRPDGTIDYMPARIVRGVVIVSSG